MASLDEQPTDQPHVSVIIVNYNAGNFLINCVKSTLDQAREVVVVDNASTDGSIAELTNHFHNEAKLKILRNSENRGFATACNMGVATTDAHSLPLFLEVT